MKILECWICFFVFIYQHVMKEGKADEVAFFFIKKNKSITILIEMIFLL